MKTKDSLERFTWERVWSEVETCCPTLTSFLWECLSPRAKEFENTIPSLCVCASILLKLQNPHVNVVQALLSLILKSGHASKQVPCFNFSNDNNYYIGYSSSSESHAILIIHSHIECHGCSCRRVWWGSYGITSIKSGSTNCKSTSGIIHYLFKAIMESHYFLPLKCGYLYTFLWS